MRGISLVWACLAYIIGLGVTGLPIPLVGLGCLIGCIGGGWEWVNRRFFPGQFPVRMGWIMAAIALFALLHYQIRLPQPDAQNISQFVEVLKSQTIVVHGTVEELPRLTRNQQMQIWLNVTGLEAGSLAPRLSQSPDAAQGRLYVTLPQAEGADLYPGQALRITGQVYSPQPAQNPGGFDFQKFLQRQNCFAGLRSESIQIVPNQPRNPFGLWQLQRRIVRAQAAHLPHPEGSLLSAMVLGGKVVDLPFELKDQFARIGLSHALAASGFQVSLILSVVLALTQRFDRRVQVTAGGAALLFFLGLSGLQPSVCRAIVMGFAVLWAMAVERKVNPIGSVLFAVTLLLLLNPLWVWDLGFQLSVLATLGLVVTVPWLTDWLDWVPTFLANAIAVPLAALIWTLPLQLQAFGVVSPYCLVANVLTTPLIVVISLGGMLNALVAALFPIVGSWTAIGLHWPIWALLRLVDWFGGLPGSTIAIGSLPVILMAMLYGLILLLWQQPELQRYGWAMGLAGSALVWFPSWHWQTHLTQITALATRDQPMWVVQAGDRVGLIADLIQSSQTQTTSLTLLPFLQQQGVNRLDWAIALAEDKPDLNSESSNGWAILAQRLSMPRLYHFASTAPIAQSQALEVDRSINRGRVRFEPLSQDPKILSLRLDLQQWLFLGKTSAQHRRAVDTPQFQSHAVLCWTGGKLAREWVRQIQPKVAIAYGSRIDPITENFLQQQGTKVYWLQRDGAIQWQPKHGFRTMDDARTSLL